MINLITITKIALLTVAEVEGLGNLAFSIND